MSAHSASPSPLQSPANGLVDESRMPRGHCRYILLHPEIKGQRCACVNFTLNKGIPGSTCDCGHLACYHNREPDVSADQKHELEMLKRRLQHLEDQLSKGQEDVLDGVVSRLNEVEEHLEKSKEEASEQIKGAYRNVSISWRSIEQAERKSLQHDEQLRQIYDKLQDHDEQLGRVRAAQLELRNADVGLDKRIKNLTESLEEEEELRLAAAAAAAPRPPRRRSTSDTSRPNVPLGPPLGAGAAHQHPYPSPTGGPVSTNINNFQELCDGSGLDAKHSTRPCHRRHAPRPALSSSAQPTGPWTVHISLLPHASAPMPFERNTTAYQRCLSRGLHRMVAVQGRDAASFKEAVEKAFGQFLRGREWMPLQAKLCDAATLQGLPMLRRLDDPKRRHPQLILGGDPACDHEFLRRHCAVVDPHGVIDSLYIAMRDHTISWHTLRRAPVFMEGLEECWAYDARLDTDPYYDADMAVDDNDRPAAGDITTVLPPLSAPVAAATAAAGLKRSRAEMSRSNSFGSGGPTAVPASASAATSVALPASSSSSSSSSSSANTTTTAAITTTSSTGELIGDEARIKRTRPAPPSASIVEIRRRDTIKTA